MNKTPNYQLNQWEKSDRIMMEDFNADNAKIEAALEALSGEHTYIGSYVGDGTDSRIIPLPFAPSIAIVFGHIATSDAVSVITNTFGFEITKDSCSSLSEFDLLLNGDTFTVRSRNWHNKANTTIHYILVR